MDYENGKGVGMCIFIVRDTYGDIVEEAILIWYAKNNIERTFAENCRNKQSLYRKNGMRRNNKRQYINLYHVKFYL